MAVALELPQRRLAGARAFSTLPRWFCVSALVSILTALCCAQVRISYEETIAGGLALLLGAALPLVPAQCESLAPLQLIVW